MRLWRAQRGNGLAYGVLATVLMILVVGALYDVYAAYHYRTWGYQAAGEAALKGLKAVGTEGLEPSRVDCLPIGGQANNRPWCVKTQGPLPRSRR